MGVMWEQTANYEKFMQIGKDALTDASCTTDPQWAKAYAEIAKGAAMLAEATKTRS